MPDFSAPRTLSSDDDEQDTASEEERENMQFNRLKCETDASLVKKLNEYPNTILIKNELDAMSSADWRWMKRTNNRIDDEAGAA